MERRPSNNVIPAITVSDYIEALSEKENFRDFPDNRSAGSITSNETLNSKFISKNISFRRLSSGIDKNKRRDSSLYSKFTALPHFKVMDDKTPIKMTNLPSKTALLSKYIVAPDGYVPNSIIREKYPPLFTAAPPQQRKKKRILGEEEDYIKKILYKHLATEKIKEVKIRSKAQTARARKKPHYEYVASDLLAIQNEVVDNFNFELEMATSEKVTEDLNITRTKKKKPRTVSAFASNVLKSRATKLAGIQDDILSRSQTASTETEEIEEELEDDIDIDILDKLEKQIQDYERLGGLVSNEKVSQRILKDRRYRIDEFELKKWLDYLELAFGSQEDMYKLIRKALNKDTEALQLLEIHIVSRQTRLGFLNTLTDPQHIFKYFLHFFGNKSDLLDCIQDILVGADKVNLKQLIYFCGEHYKLQEFFSEFVGVKNYVLNILSAKITSEKDRIIAFEKCLRDGMISDDIVFSIFMSSESDAKTFFELIPECRLKDMTNIIKHMKEIQEIQRTLTKKMTSKMSTEVVSSHFEPTPPILIRKEMRIERIPTVELPPLPEYNEHSWKKMMSQYIANMLSTIAPSDREEDKSKRYFEDENLLGLLKELGFLHTEVLKLLKVYLNNDECNAKKLFLGLIAEDNFAYQALIELIGEKEAMQIIKSLRLKQAKVIEKIIESHGNDEQTVEAKNMLRGMLHYLPESLSRNLNTWLNAGQVTAADISQAVEVLSEKLSPDSPDKESLLSDFNTFIMDDWKSRPSMMTHFSKEHEEEITRGPLRRMSMMNTKIEYEYRDLVERETEKEGVISYEESVSINGSVGSISSPHDPQLKGKQHIDVTTVHEKYTMKTKEEIIEARVCEDVCNIAWFTAEPLLHYDEVMIKIADMIKESDDIQHTHEMATMIINISERTFDKHIKEAVARKLVEHVITLIQEDDEEQKEWLGYMTPNIYDEIDLDKNEPSATNAPTFDLQELTRMNYDKVIKAEQAKSFEEAIIKSYYKHMKVKNMIQVLKKIEIKKGEELEKVIINKTHICPLFLPEFTEQINIVRHLGMEYYEPYELVSSSANVIIRKNKEEVKRHAIKSHRAEDADRRPLTKKMSDNLKDIVSLQVSLSSDISVTGKDLYSVDSDDVLPSDQHPAMDLRQSPLIESEEPEKLSDIKELPVTYKGLSDTSVMNLKDAMTIHSFIMKGEVFKPECIEEEVIDQDDGSLKHDSLISRILPKPISQKRKPKDPYSDFHTLYGATSYYLPYIRPELQMKSRSREDSLPMYSAMDKHDNTTFYSVSKMIDGFGKSKTKVTPSFANSRFISRPSNVPLKDWVKLGSLGMATNMVLANQAYKAENTKCRFHRLTKLGLHKYGLSATRFLERCDMVEFISKSNTAATHEKVKSKIEGRSQLESRASESSGSLLKSF